jgi:hypothetical protein
VRGVTHAQLKAQKTSRGVNSIHYIETHPRQGAHPASLVTHNIVVEGLVNSLVRALTCAVRFRVPC